MICLPLRRVRLPRFRRRRSRSGINRSPPGCGRAISANSPGNRTFSAPASCFAAPSRPIAFSRSFFSARPAPAKRRSPRSSRARPKANSNGSAASNQTSPTCAACCQPRANRLENNGQPTILFIDEIHRFNKAQQDVLLARRRERRGPAHRRDDAQSVFLRQLAAGVAFTDFRAAAVERGGTVSPCCSAR